MGHGGKRRGAGRKPGGVTKRSRAVADDIVESGRTPLAYMLRIMEDTTADPMRRDEMARAAAVYCHPRLSSITTSNTNVNFEGGGDITTIVAVPRGATLAADGSITIDGEAVTELSSVEPYTGTAPLELTDQSQATSFEPPEPLRVIEPEPNADNVTPLAPWRRRDESP
jgi:hypothetical protein